MRRTLVGSIVVALLANVPVLASADPISGEWDLTFHLKDTTTAATLTLALDGHKVSGTCYSDHTGPGTLRDGTWIDNTLSFKLEFAKHDTIALSGTLKDGMLAGEFRTEGFVDAWNATRKQAAAPVIQGGLPVVSPAGDQILFVSNRDGVEDLFVINASGTGETRLTNTPETETGLQWSADGKHVIYSVLLGDTSRLYAIDPDGRNKRQLGSVPGRTPMLSPDGMRVVYMAGTWTATKLLVSALDGSQGQQITDGSSIAWNNHWSPDGKHLAFTGRNDPNGELGIYVMNADGSERRQVTHIASEEGGAQWPVWSPDGRQFAIQVNSRLQKGAAHIWIVDVGTGTARKLAAHGQPYLDETPAWFPDGTRIAFQSNRTGRMEVWAMNADGSGERQVTGVTAPGAPLPSSTDDLPLKRMALFTWVVDYEPFWSPDGRQIVLISSRHGGLKVHVIDSGNSNGGSDIRQLTKGDAEDDTPAWSPNGTMIAYVSIRDDVSQIVVMNADGTNARQLTTGKAENIHPTWSPDSERILFNTTYFARATAADGRDVASDNNVIGEQIDKKMDLATIRPDGTDLKRITSGGGFTYASFSPDGRSIVHRRVQGALSQVFVMNADGSNDRNVSGDGTLDGWPAWSANGDRIVFSRRVDDRFQLFVMNRDGSGVRQLTDAAGEFVNPRWSPDGSKILCARRLGSMNLAIFAAPK